MLPLLDVLAVTGLEAGALLLHRLALAGLGLASGLGPLLTKPDELHLVALFREDCVALLRVVRRALRLVVCAEPLASISNHSATSSFSFSFCRRMRRPSFVSCKSILSFQLLASDFFS